MQICLLLLLPAMLALPSHADGYWLLHVDVVTPASVVPNSGNVTWTPPADSHNSITLGALTAQRHAAGVSATYSQSISLTVKITGTWTGSDPAPPPVKLIESGKAHWTSYYGQPNDSSSGSANDGLEGADSTGTAQTPTTDANGHLLVPPAHLTPESGNTWSITRSFSASATVVLGTPPKPLTRPNYWGVTASFDSYTIAVHAQPYGWYDVGWTDTNGTHHAGPLTDNTNGTLTFEYGWKSTDGNLADLKGITIYEYLSYSGPGRFSADNTTFYPAPPAAPGYSVFNGKAGTQFDASKLYAVDSISPFSTGSSLSAQTWTAAQKYEFDDPATGEIGTVLYDAGSITDAVQLNPNQFYVSKSGYSATKPL